MIKPYETLQKFKENLTMRNWRLEVFYLYLSIIMIRQLKVMKIVYYTPVQFYNEKLEIGYLYLSITMTRQLEVMKSVHHIIA